MIIFKSLDEINNTEECACALGNFDGVHKGHQELINTAVRLSKEKGLKSAVFTFTDHPVNVMSGHTVIKNIFSFNDKISAMENLGVDYLFTVPFDNHVRTMSPLDFAASLMADKLKIRHAVCGFNYNFGYKAGGNHDMLIEFGKQFGFDTTVIEPVQVEGVTVSSTLIRGCIEKGDMESYLAYSGRQYSIFGKVIEGEHNGRKMGFPTVNLSLDPDMALPANGVYTTLTEIDGVRYPSITNVGNKPTIGEFAKNAETYIFNFNELMYGKKLKVLFIKMQRPERRFDSMEALAQQIKEDCMEAKRFHEIQ